MSPSLKSSIATVNQLKAALLKEHEKGGKDHSELDTEKCMDLLSRLDEVPMNLPILSETLIGTAVSKLKSCGNDEVSAAAKKLVKKWKKCAKEGTATGARAAEKPAVAVAVAVAASSSLSSSKSSAAVRKPAAAAAAAAVATSSSVKIEANVPDEWRDLPPNRRTVCGKLFELLSLSSSASTTPSEAEVRDVATAIERAISDHSKDDRSAYSSKARQLNFNLKKNAELRLALLRGDTAPSRLVTMSSEEMATSEQSKQREDKEKKLQDSRRLDWEQANEAKINEMCGIKGDLLKASLFTCGRCKSTKTTSTQKQTRSADEPMTVFVLCQNCGKRWKC